jgi:ElaB/YqjD/DUF883 family membrane-anchored ribosome-binding protein
MDVVRQEAQFNRDLEEMTDEIQAGIKDGRYSLGEIQRSLKDKTKDAAAVTDEFVRGNPWASLGIAALAGCIVGFLLHRK